MIRRCLMQTDARGKVDLGRGIKAGLVAAGVFLVVTVILRFTGLYAQYWEVFFAAGLSLESMPPRPVVVPGFEVSMLEAVAMRIVGGVAFGAIFAALYSHLPGRFSVVKGVVLSVFLWILGMIASIYLYLGWPEWSFGGLSWWGGAVSGTSVSNVLASLGATLAFGALVGGIWRGLSGKEVTPARSGTVALLVAWIAGSLLWLGTAVPYVVIYVLGEVIIGGHPFVLVTPGDWWSMLMAVTVFAGPVGWILTLLAWRKTRRGEAGFGLGLAGGIIMFVTIMPIPGALAIIGGVLSRREPVEGAVSGSESGAP